MRGPATWAMIAAGVVFAIFFANVVTGALGGKAFLSDIGEMLTLFFSSIIFVIALLYQEQMAKTLSTQPENEK